MKKFLTLIEIELRHLIFILIGIFLLMTGISGLLTFTGASANNQDATRIMTQGSLSAAEFVASHGYFTLSTLPSATLMTAVFILFFYAMLAFVSFWIWQKEWAGKSKGIYFLLSLRAPRSRLLATKLLVTLTASWLFFGMVLLNLFIGGLIMNIVIDSRLVGSQLVAGYLQNASWILSFVLPTSAIHFIYHTLFTTAVFLAMTSWVLLAKSFNWFGGIIGFIYTFATVVIYTYIQFMWLFYDERLLVEWSFVILSCLISFPLSMWLVAKRISV